MTDSRELRPLSAISRIDIRVAVFLFDRSLVEKWGITDERTTTDVNTLVVLEA